MKNKRLKMLLIAGVVLTSITEKLDAIELQDKNSTLRQTWDSGNVEIKIDELQGELDNMRKEEALKKLKEILGIRGKFKKDGYKDLPPQFMLELYNTVSDSDGKIRGNNPYNAKIVRSFIEKGSSSLRYYIFNISGLEQNELVLEAELHLYRKRSSPKSMPLSILSSPYYLIRVYQVLRDKSLDEPDLHRLLNVHYVGAYASGWQVFNVKQAVLSWLSGAPNLGLLVSATTIFGDLVSVDFSKRNDLSHDKQPILVLFNDYSTNIYSKQVPNKEEENNELEENTELRDGETFMKNIILQSDRARNKRYSSIDISKLEEAPEYITGNRSKHFYREKKQQEAPMFALGFVSRRKNWEHMLTSMDIYQRAMLREKLNIRKEGIDVPDTLEKRSRIRRDAVAATAATVAASTVECRKPQLEPCTKRELYVNFRDIGLSTIIAPEGYAAYQCRGHCESPLSQEQKPTNHATIQGIIHKMNLASSQDVETPCCVPVNLSSISILYHDEERDGVVLKSYTDMAVVSCGCR